MKLSVTLRFSLRVPVMSVPKLLTPLSSGLMALRLFSLELTLNGEFGLLGLVLSVPPCFPWPAPLTGKTGGKHMTLKFLVPVCLRLDIDAPSAFRMTPLALGLMQVFLECGKNRHYVVKSDLGCRMRKCRGRSGEMLLCSGPARRSRVIGLSAVVVRWLLGASDALPTAVVVVMSTPCRVVSSPVLVAPV